MKLLTKEIERKFRKFPIYSQDGKGMESEVLVKYFNPTGVGTWIITEAEQWDDGDWRLYGLCEIGYGYEWGYVLLSQLQQYIGRYGLGIERDLYIGDSPKVKDLVREDEIA